jgi:hypothetical protein
MATCSWHCWTYMEQWQQCSPETALVEAECVLGGTGGAGLAVFLLWFAAESWRAGCRTAQQGVGVVARAQHNEQQAVSGCVTTTKAVCVCLPCRWIAAAPSRPEHAAPHQGLCQHCVATVRTACKLLASALGYQIMSTTPASSGLPGGQKGPKRRLHAGWECCFRKHTTD